MTRAVEHLGVSDGVVADLLARVAAPSYARWEEQVRQVGYCVRQVGYCARPVRLAGQVTTLDPDTGTRRVAYSTASEPDGCLLKACGQRRETVCASCSAVYRSDAFQLLAAGLRGGKGVPESVTGHPTVFVTFTAPGFGAVHARRERHGTVERCHPRRGEVCRHGRRIDCRVRHGHDNEALGEPLCPECFDYEAAVVWNALAPELWRRTTIYLRRALARAAGLSVAELGRRVRLSYAKVVEYQRRGLVHFHAVVRLDAAGPAASGVFEAPPASFSAELLEQALRAAAASVSAPAPAGRAPVRWGDQLDVRRIDEGGVGTLSRGAVAGYVAKYATKSTDPLGRLDARLKSLDDLDARGVTGHVRAMAETAWRLGAEPDLAELGLRRSAHTLGFRGHWMTKSRRYSTTFGTLRQARAAWACEQGHDEPSQLQDGMEVGTWRLVGVGYRTEGDRWLAVSAGAWAREERRIAREELRTAA